MDVKNTSWQKCKKSSTLNEDEEEVGNFGSDSDGSKCDKEDNNCDDSEGKKDYRNGEKNYWLN
jgi:hypothetical protein